jgi:heat shock protein HtpX
MLSCGVVPFTYRITPEVPPSYYGKLFDFMYTDFLAPQKERFVDVVRESTGVGERLDYVVVDSRGNRLIHVEVKGGTPLELKIEPLSSVASHTVVEEAKQDVLIAMQFFNQNARNASVYFAWREGEKVVPEAYTKPVKSFNRLFLETQVLFFVVFIVFGMFIFISISVVSPEWFWVAPLVLIGIQFVFVFFSPRLIVRGADWHITRENPVIHLLEYYLPVSAHSSFSKSYPRETLMAIKREIYDDVIRLRGAVDVLSAQRVFLEHGVPCELENLKATRVDVYGLVKGIADKFGFPVPEVVVSNTMVPNAAASGPSPKRGLVLITTGILVQLSEAELRGVLGHEFGHLKGRDPLLLYGLVSLEFLFRFYVLFPLFPLVFSSFLFFAYFWGVMVVIFFIAKFFEARADLVSAMVVGDPHVLAGSLEKIGFQRLLYERTPSFRVQEWLGLDPHPPIYFRVDRLKKLSGVVRRPLLRSIRDVLRGFVATLRG